MKSGISADDLAALEQKWYRRLETAKERDEALFVTHEELDELRAMDAERRRQADLMSLMVEDLNRAAGLVPIIGHPVVVDAAARREQLGEA